MNDYERVANVIRFLDRHHTEQPDLHQLASAAGLSPFHFHRLFSAWAGVTPKDFLQCLTLEHVKHLLRNGDNVFDAALNAGLSGPGRLHDLCVTLEAASPGEMKNGGAGMQIEYGFAETPFGQARIAELSAKIFTQVRDRASRPTLRAFVRGTPFQLRVWRALLRVPSGSLTTYGRLAQAIGQSQAARAVGSAVGANPIAFIIPCHRVIRETGALGHYHWDPVRKRAIVGWELSPRAGATE